MRTSRLLPALLTLGLLAACGGGGGAAPAIAFVLKARLEPQGVTALYGYDAQGALQRRLSGPLSAGWGVDDILQGPDPRWVVFADDKLAADRQQLFLADLEAWGDPTPLTSLPAGPGSVSVSLLSFSPDGTRVLFHANLAGDTQWGLHVVPLAGGGPTQLSTPGMKLPSSVTYWSPDGTRVTWLEGPTNNGPWVQMVANADGSGAVPVSGPMVAGGGVRMMQGNMPWASDGSRLVFVADKEVDETFELYSVQPDGTGQVKLSPPLGANGDVADFACSSVGGWVALSTTPASYKLWTVPAAGGVAAGTWSVASESVSAFRWMPGGTRLAWSSYDTADGLRHLRSRVVGAGSTQELYTAAAGEDLASDWRWSPQGGRIAFRVGDEDILQDHLRLHTVPGDGAAPAVNVLPSITASGDVQEYGWSWSPDGTRLLAKASEQDVTRADLYLALADGSAAWQLSQVSVEQEGISDTAFSVDGQATAWIQGWSEPHQQFLVGTAGGPGGYVVEWQGPGREMDELLPR